MKKSLKISISIILTILLIGVICFVTFYIKLKTNTIAKLRAVIVREDEYSLTVATASGGLVNVGKGKEKNKSFKEGQEVLIYYNGLMLQTYPEQISNVGKIKIVKEKSNIQIPEYILRYCFSKEENVSVNISNINTNEIELDIKDTNEIPYIYSNKYSIVKKVKNPNYTGIGYKIGEDTPNSIAGYSGTGLEYIWEEVDKVSNIEGIAHIEKTNLEKGIYVKLKCDWSTVYSKLGTGEYKISFSDIETKIISIEFYIGEDGTITTKNPEMLT